MHNNFTGNLINSDFFHGLKNKAVQSPKAVSGQIQNFLTLITNALMLDNSRSISTNVLHKTANYADTPVKEKVHVTGTGKSISLQSLLANEAINFSPLTKAVTPEINSDKTKINKKEITVNSVQTKQFSETQSTKVTPTGLNNRIETTPAKDIYSELNLLKQMLNIASLSSKKDPLELIKSRRVSTELIFGDDTVNKESLNNFLKFISAIDDNTESIKTSEKTVYKSFAKADPEIKLQVFQILNAAEALNTLQNKPGQKTDSKQIMLLNKNSQPVFAELQLEGNALFIKAPVGLKESINKR